MDENQKREAMFFDKSRLIPIRDTKRNHSFDKGIALFLCILFIGLAGCESNENPVLESCVSHKEGGIHFHVSLVLVHNKQPQMLPAGIGITDDCMKPVHTHSEDFIIHVEHKKPLQFTMGDFFVVWGEDNPYIRSEVVSISLNGKRYNEDYRELRLEDGQNIVLEFSN